MDGRGLIFFGSIALLFFSGVIYRQIGNPYCIPQAKAKQAKPKLRLIIVRRRFWTSGFV